ncbi:3-(cis-5,6-dihydroxycyclohexa-1,3-dien-1-yl)propanoate dehydrogenase [Pseudalkalibacillus decolorationis]|uniref:3-(cis-5,6-dihydroxycyclohexa-1, 3-dien-1-yl)propanoate dehydrogenase n=1 Tax=Pseudalkalibacillus decolorationis TaxID=163879 RepID=UPI0021491805|nr:3-(cis-5,6-dihydroxycyclohexa-1,3-dien-1-yl)propanoate dehydrogenase [Pseudalkalibacillus decolorationis]
MGSLEGKVALITGGGAGIGSSIVERFLNEQAKVCVFDLSEKRLALLKEKFGERIHTVCGDVKNYQDNERAVSSTVNCFGKLDSFVANAGVFDGFNKLLDLKPDVLNEAYEELFSINVKGYLFGARAALPELMKTKGNMIFTISGASFYPDGGGVLYTASKHAGLGLIRQLAFESAPNVRVNGVAPGGTITDLTITPSLRPYSISKTSGEREASIKNRNPLRMAMQPEDHVSSYVLLASDQSRAITGEVISSDGGLGVRGLS